MKKIVIIFVFLLIITLIGLYNFKDEEMKVIEINKTSSIFNKEGISHIDTILYVGLDILRIDGLIIVIKGLDGDRKIDSGTTLRAYIKNAGNQYILYMSKMGRRESIKVLSHELIHIKQYNDGRLIDDGDNIIWYGEKINKGDLGGINYFERGWEVEAFDKQDSLEYLILKKLYK